MNAAFDAHREAERRTSAITLSDMELFIFPELIYSLVLANIMSPILWRWREDPWFKGIHKKSLIARVNRLKQFIMDHYAFNLDLDTWGMTTKERELARFEGIVDATALAQSNALFGYEGDRYYFDIDIRRHFGLDRYAGNVIPYWKTETIEAMTAFQRRSGFTTGAGECVSLSALYAAALFVVLGIPLKDIFLMATPLHSQNFLDIAEGVVTNNRRIVTKTMWFNGTAISGQARRSMEHERITLVAHETGTIHIFYPDATMDPAVYARFSRKLSDYLTTPLTSEMLGNFLRQAPEKQTCLLIRRVINGVALYAPLARAFAYEQDCSYKVTDQTLPKLLEVMAQDEFSPRSCEHCIVYNDLVEYLESNPVDLHHPDDLARLVERFQTTCHDAEGIVQDLVKFCHVEPQLPNATQKRFENLESPLNLEPGMTRDQILSRVESLRETNTYCRLAFYAYRDLSRTESTPFLTAAVERNPVCIAAAATRFPQDADWIAAVNQLGAESIYEESGRLAQPDEVWNFGTGDGLERAILLSVVLHARHGGTYAIHICDSKVRVIDPVGQDVVTWITQKQIRESILKIETERMA